MRVAAGIGLFILAVPLSSVAQTAPPAQNPTLLRPDSPTVLCDRTLVPGSEKGDVMTVCRTTPMVPACPIDMHVRQGIGGGMLAVDANGVKRQVFAPRNRLFLSDIQEPARKIVSATVKVRGWNGKARTLPAASNSDSYSDPKSGTMQRTLTVNLAPWGEPGESGDFRLPGFTSANRIDLESVTYEDGSTWTVAPTNTCRVAPDPLMLIAH